MATVSAAAASAAPEAPGMDEKKDVDTTTTPSGPRKIPFAFPAPGCTPPPANPLTSEQETKYGTVLSTAESWTEIPDSSKAGSASSAITSDERQWLTRECLLRYLRATKWNTAEASKRLLATLTWRREYGAKSFTADYISEENETGKQVIAGFDKEGRPCLYLIPSRQNTQISDRQTHHLVFMLERAIDLMPPGQETLALVIDYRETGTSKNPPLSQSRGVLNILQGHFPERLGRALISHLPWYINTFYKLISPFIDPVTKTKMKFNEPLPDHVPKEHLLKSHSGDVEFEYDHETYWPTMNKMCEERREEQRKRWEARGSKVGESEWYLKGGDVDEKPEEMAKEVEEVTKKVEETQIEEKKGEEAPTEKKEGEAS